MTVVRDNLPSDDVRAGTRADGDVDLQTTVTTGQVAGSHVVTVVVDYPNIPEGHLDGLGELKPDSQRRRRQSRLRGRVTAQ
jgi:hypothetical protein